MGEDAARGDIRGADQSNTSRRLTVDQAADQLGVTVDAIRSRIKRGTIDHVREGGRVYVMLGADHTAPSHAQGDVQGRGQSDLVEVLREQLAAEREANREMRRLLAAALERIPEIEAPREEPESPESAGGEPTGTPPPPEPEEATSRPWWRRMFGG